MKTLTSLVKFGLIFLVTAIGLYALYQVLVSPCDTYTPILKDEVRCSCTGIKFNLDNWLGNPATEVYQKQCFGIVTEVVKQTP